MTESKENKSMNLVQKIVASIKDAKSVKEDGYNNYSHYSYTTDKQVSSVARSLTNHGVIAIPNLSVSEKWKEGKNNFVQVTGTYVLTDGNDTLKARCDGIGADTLDKAVYKAETGAKKNFFMQLMLLSSDDDTDDDHDKGLSNQSSNQNSGYQNQQASQKQLKFIKSLFHNYGAMVGKDEEKVMTATISRVGAEKLSDLNKNDAKSLISHMQATIKKLEKTPSASK